ncbi:MAG: MATE family efflux transporter [Lachnospiraceae bacterium]|nr:MATE family efflux transporter [Lachnospiraceae bacterium]
MSTTQIKDFTKGNITKQLILFASPLFLSNLLQVVYNMVDMIIVGNKLGKLGISAVSIGGDVSHFLTFVAIGFANAGQVLIAKYIGAKQREKISKFVGTMSGFLLACALVISIAGLVFKDEILQLMNTPAESYEGAASYSVICMVGLVFIYGYNIVSAILRGMGDSKHPFIFISIAAVLNLVLDIVFVLGMDYGAGGAAVATVVSQAASFLLCVVFLAKNKEAFALNMNICDFIRWDKAMLVDLIKLGTPMAIKTASIQISKLFVNSWINSYGIAVSAFAGIANKVAGISNLVSAALNTAGSTMVGQNIAAREYGRVKQILKRLAVITLSIAAIISVILFLYPTQIFGVFTNDILVLDIGVKYIPIAVLLFFGSALRAIMNALMNGSGNTKVNFATAILDGIVLRIGLSVLFGLALGLEYYGFWLGDALAGFTPFWIGIVFYISGRWKNEQKNMK